MRNNQLKFMAFSCTAPDEEGSGTQLLQNWHNFWLVLVKIGDDRAAVLFAVMGLAVPAILKPHYTIWMIFALILGWVMSRVILTLFYSLVLTPIGLAGRVFGEHFLHIKWLQESATYWVRRKGPGREKSDYERQF
jgi:hypothetical protein